MSVSAKCSICQHEEKEKLEALGLEALQGLRSWRDAAVTMGGLSHPNGLKHHMKEHYVHSVIARAQQEEGNVLAGFLKEALEELTKAMAVASTETKPLYAMMIHNLSALEQTKPSQQSLIAAAKAIHEITGMNLKQRMLLDYAETFHLKNAEPVAPALAEYIIDVEEVEDGSPD